MKKLINAADDVVGEALDGLTLANAGIARLAGSTTAIRSDVAAVRAAGHVALLSGGGAGHEPAHAGYVGAGMLTGAVSGEVFTSPSVDAVLDAIRAVATPGGVLLIVKNYTGDRLNFGLAAELARAEGIAVETVVVADDVALTAETGAGRRGLAGTVLVHKVAGAAAAAGLPLDKVAERAQRVADTVGTMGLALSPCTVPAAGQPGFLLEGDEIEWGLGIHGEPGVERAGLRPAHEVVARLANAILDDRGIGSGQRVALMVNGLGATPPMELSIVADAAARDLRDRGVRVERVWAGNFLTALDMAGCSLSVLPVDDDLLAALDAPTTAPAWPATTTATEPASIAAPSGEPAVQGTLPADDPVRRALESVAEALISVRDELTELDREVGDGDLGISLARGAAAVLADCPAYPGEAGPAAVLRATSATLRRSMGGTSGPLYAIMLLRAAAAMPASPPPAAPLASPPPAAMPASPPPASPPPASPPPASPPPASPPPASPPPASEPAAASQSASPPGAAWDGRATPQDWAAAFRAGVDGVREVGGAEVGDRTMVDALAPAADAFESSLAGGASWRDALAAAADAAAAGAAATAEIRARLGRSSYLGDRVLGHPDPGAQAVALWLTAIAGPAQA